MTSDRVGYALHSDWSQAPSMIDPILHTEAGRAHDRGS